MKKLLSILLALVLMLGVFTAVPMTASASIHNGIECGDYKYHVLEDGTVEINDYNGSAKALEIPSVLDGYTVTRIGSYSFDYSYMLTSITIPNTVTNIYHYAFYH